MSDDLRNDSGIEIKPLYSAADLDGWDPAAKLGTPGEQPYTRGVYPTMYRGKLWTMRQYAGFGTPESTNERFKFLLGAGQTGLSCAFDLPTQMGYDSDHPRAEGEVGKVGVAIEEQGVPASAISGTIQNDLLKEYIARGTYVYPPRQSMRIITDIFEYCAKHVPKWNTISISGYHIREAGSTAVQEIAFTIANGIAYVDAAIAAGLDVDEFAPRLSFFWNAHNNFFEEVAKYRAARRIWFNIMNDRFKAKKESSKLLRFHTQTGGSTLTAQQPENNIVRVALQSMAAVMGGTQSLHTNGYDEALSLPTERAARIALRTQQIIGYESGIVDTPDPLAGSYFVETLTDEMERLALEYIAHIDELGGAVAAIEAGYQMSEIENAAYDYAKSIDNDERVIVGVNMFAVSDDPEPEVFPVNPELERGQKARLGEYKAARDQVKLQASLAALIQAAQGTDNILYPMKEALRVGATLGEISDALRGVFGLYQP